MTSHSLGDVEQKVVLGSLQGMFHKDVHDVHQASKTFSNAGIQFA